MSRVRAVWSESMLFAISFSICNRVCKRTEWILVRLRGRAGWSGSMLVANALCWFCRDAAQMYLKVKYWEVNKENNLHIAKSTCSPCKLPKVIKIRKNSPYCVSNAVEIYRDEYCKFSAYSRTWLVHYCLNDKSLNFSKSQSTLSTV
jgi:hypothetical protein